jgi:ADP-sugar diphosphatase
LDRSAVITTLLLQEAFLEIPAGMLDEHSGEFAGVAAKELKEETGLEIKEDELIDMTALAYGLPAITSAGGETAVNVNFVTHGNRQLFSCSSLVVQDKASDELSRMRGWYPSVGACDEFLRLLYYFKEVSREEMQKLQGAATGNIEEGEVITLDLIPLDELWRRTPDGKTLAAILLYEKLLAQGKIPS